MRSARRILWLVLEGRCASAVFGAWCEVDDRCHEACAVSIGPQGTERFLDSPRSPDLQVQRLKRGKGPRMMVRPPVRR